MAVPSPSPRYVVIAVLDEAVQPRVAELGARQGWDLVKAPTILDAVRQLRLRLPQGVVQVVVGEADKARLVQLMRTDLPRVPILAVSSADDAESEWRVRSAGATCYLAGSAASDLLDHTMAAMMGDGYRERSVYQKTARADEAPSRVVPLVRELAWTPSMQTVDVEWTEPLAGEQRFLRLIVRKLPRTLYFPNEARNFVLTGHGTLIPPRIPRKPDEVVPVLNQLRREVGLAAISTPLTCVNARPNPGGKMQYDVVSATIA